MGKETRARKHQVTINNPVEHGFTHDRIKKILEGIKGVTYWCMGDEIGDEGTLHTCLYIHTENQMRFSTVKGKFPVAHIEVARGTARENRAYILKEGEKHLAKAHTTVEGTFEEWGECPEEQPGRRNDLHELVRGIEAGKTNKELIDENPRNALRLMHIDRIRQTIVMEKHRYENRNVKVYYLSGTTGCGKTRSVMGLDRRDVYHVTTYEHPWDDYQGQSILCLDEFRSSLKIGEILHVLDIYPCALPARYCNKYAAWETVYVLSNIPFEAQYPDKKRDEPETWAAFQRRFDWIDNDFHYGKPIGWGNVIIGGKSA